MEQEKVYWHNLRPASLPPKDSYDCFEGSAIWPKQRNSHLESALAILDNLDSHTVWEDVASMVPGIDAALVKKRYEMLLGDITGIVTSQTTSSPNYDMSALSLAEEEQCHPPALKKQKLWTGRVHAMNIGEANKTRSRSRGRRKRESGNIPPTAYFG